MAAKRYLSLEEAAQLLGVRTDEVIRLREKGELRGFADRGTWKFKSDDVEEVKRRRQPDSNPEVPLISDDDAPRGTALDEDEDLSRQATVIRKGGPTSDSDVRLLASDRLTGSSAEIPIVTGPGSDSDVRLVGAQKSKPAGKGSDSDVKLIKPKDSDSGVRLSDSDSDVRLASKRSDSDVKLKGGRSDSDVRLDAGSDSDVKLVGGPDSRVGGNAIDLDIGDSVLLDDDSGVPLPADSGIQLAGDSGIRLTSDSSLRLAGDSGVQLRQPADSGILLERPGESGVRRGGDDDSILTLADDSGIRASGDVPRSSSLKLRRPSDQDDLEMTAPMLLSTDDEGSRTDPEVPLLFDEAEESPPRGKKRGSKTDAETSVIMFDDEEEADQTSATMVKKKSPGLSSKEFGTSTFDLEGEEGEVDVAEDLLEEEEGLDEELEVFESEDSDFGEFEEGASSAAIRTVGGGKIAAPLEAEWGGLSVALLSVSAIALCVGAMVAVDLLRVIYAGAGPVEPGGIVDGVAALFK